MILCFTIRCVAFKICMTLIPEFLPKVTKKDWKNISLNNNSAIVQKSHAPKWGSR